MQDRRNSGYYYLQVGQLPPIYATALLALARVQFDPGARFTRDNLAIETRLAHRACLDALARELLNPEPPQTVRRRPPCRAA